MKEIWKDIIGYEGLYSVSNTGLVKRVTTNKIKNNSVHSIIYPIYSSYKLFHLYKILIKTKKIF